MKVYSFTPFGYEGSLCEVEVDLRRGIPAVDIVGLADGAVKEQREIMRAAISNSGLEFPPERVLISLCPADIRKDNDMALTMAVGILNAQNPYPCGDAVLILGGMELSGRIYPARGAYAAINTARAAGISKVCVCDAQKEEVDTISGIEYIVAEDLLELNEKLKKNEWMKSAGSSQTDEVTFNTEKDEIFKDLKLKPSVVRAIEIAIAGKHHMLSVGAPGCGKTMAILDLVPALSPDLTYIESQSTTRVWSIAGLLSPHTPRVKHIPFRMPHQTASIEGICGGGISCRPGEISLAHNGVLFLDEAAEFRTSCLQMLRCPIESRSITLSRAGRTTKYPADFQLFMATNPCPCGNYGTKHKLCLDSAKSIELYWRKFSGPLIDRIAIRYYDDEDEEALPVDIEKLRKEITTARKIQGEIYNNNINPQDFPSIGLSKEITSYLDHKELTPRELANMIRVSKTIANLDGRTIVNMSDVEEALSYNKKLVTLVV